MHLSDIFCPTGKKPSILEKSIKNLKFSVNHLMNAVFVKPVVFLPKIKNRLNNMKRKNIQKIIPLLLIAALIFQGAFSFAFLHIHVLPNGQITYHSHPSNDNAQSARSEKNGHSHTRSEFFFYYVNTVLSLLSLFLFLLILIIPRIDAFWRFDVLHFYCRFVRGLFSRRAPPFVFNITHS